ncbi:MAG: 1-(5-phosphoribosyl)-5-[(5-phosphoribosylamino)methylideneamino]imidazole-4-carboxamide isomerase [Candidatus Aenigmatarchaeota archaeon]|nr:MAG: 1-(5-phosphoribosyl)-5-[(5-phosphoribosylamino)methylideneamino]imidazole-4-carboxamide isomerase [Candidatus Aenigmarchaeota archaeon]
MLIIPAIDLKQGKVVRLWKGDFQRATVYEDDALKVARRWKEEGAERLHIVDLDGAKTGNFANLNIVKDIVRIGVQVQFGGGVRDKQSFKKIIDSGIAYLILGSAIKDRNFLDWALESFLEKIIISIDAQGQNIYLRGWQEKSGLCISDIAQFLKKKAVKRIIYSDIERDGTLKGFNIKSLKRILSIIDIPIMVAGGISSLDDIRRLKEIKSPNLEGVIIGRALYEGRFRLKEAIRQ